ncbi:MAG: hypothetical protein K2M06_01065, partial [Muribaculaceae bacterium]|nr:hypothetical protein [Muribaculaceae bacterium]
MAIIALSFPTSELIDLDSLISEACSELKADIIVRDLRRNPIRPRSGIPDADETEAPDEDDDDMEDDENNADEETASPDGDDGPGADLLVCTRHRGLRGVFLHSRRTSANLGLATPASPGDYELLSYFATRLRQIIGREPEFHPELNEADYYSPESFDGELFSVSWCVHCQMMDFARMLVTVVRGNMPAIFECYNFPAAIGPRLLASHKLYPVVPPSARSARNFRRLMQFLAHIQWTFEDRPRTATGQCMIRRFDDPEEREAMENNDFTDEDAKRILEELRAGKSDAASLFTMSAIPVGISPDSLIPSPQLILYGDYLCFLDIEAHEQLALVPFTCLRHLVDDVPGAFIDELQYAAEKPLDDSVIAGMLNEAPRYTPPTPFMSPTYPGMGTPDGQRTFVFFWRPGVNGPKIDSFRRFIRRMQLMTIAWNIDDHREARMGDRFFLVCTSPRMPKGIVMSGILSSNPYPRGDGSWGVELKPNFMMDPRHPSLVTADLLADAIPDFDWRGTTGGRRLSDDDAATLEDLWAPELDHALSLISASMGEETSVNAILPEECTY